MASFLVTGGAGFIGSNLVERLVARGDAVRVLDDFSTGHRRNLEPWLDAIELIDGSIVSADDCARAVDGVDYVLHHGAMPSVPKSVQLPLESNEVNVSGTLRLLIAARDAKVKRVVFAASSSAYGDTPTLPKIETMSPNPMSPYAVQKHAGEEYMRVFWDVYGLQTVSLRYFNIFGPRQDPTSQYGAVIPKFVSAILEGKGPTIFGDGSQSRDFTYIDNVVHANLCACEAPDSCAGQLVNIACGERIDLVELVRVVNGVLGTSLEPVFEPERVGDVKHSLADIQKARDVIGYEPQVSFAEGIRRTIEWYQAHRDFW
jgi:nucleoside-diphosphate-sugar epimerase